MLRKVSPTGTLNVACSSEADTSHRSSPSLDFPSNDLFSTNFLTQEKMKSELVLICKSTSFIRSLLSGGSMRWQYHLPFE